MMIPKGARWECHAMSTTWKRGSYGAQAASCLDSHALHLLCSIPMTAKSLAFLYSKSTPSEGDRRAGRLQVMPGQDPRSKPKLYFNAGVAVSPGDTSRCSCLPFWYKAVQMVHPILPRLLFWCSLLIYLRDCLRVLRNITEQLQPDQLCWYFEVAR